MIEKILHLFGLSRTFGAARSPQFSALSREMIKEANGLCQMGLHKPIPLVNALNTHHIFPFHEQPRLELEKSNLIVLCRLHHFLNGHFKDWKDSNVKIREDCEALNEVLKNRP